MEIVADLGMHQGIAVTFGGGRAGIGLSTDDGCDRRARNLPMIRAICMHFYETFRDIKTAGASLPVDPRSLSIKEREVLTWVAVGKTDYEIAEILGIRQKTVEAHLRNL